MVDLAHTKAFLATRFEGEASAIAPLGAGVWSQAFAFRRAGRDYVIRFGLHGDDFARDRLAAAFAGPALPIPAVLELGEAFDGYYAIAERVYGGYIDDVGEAQMRGLLPALLAALDAMRLADLAYTTGYGGWDASGNGAWSSWRVALLDVANDRPGDRIHGWRARLATSDVGSEPFDAAYRRLDFVHEARRHYAAIGLAVPGFEQRLLCCQLHIGLAGMAYQAYAGDWTNVRRPIVSVRKMTAPNSCCAMCTRSSYMIS